MKSPNQEGPLETKELKGLLCKPRRLWDHMKNDQIYTYQQRKGAKRMSWQSKPCV